MHSDRDKSRGGGSGAKGQEPGAKRLKRTTTSTRKPPAQRTRLWLTYPQRLIQEPVIWQLGKRFKLVTNVRQVSVTEQIGIVSLELEGDRQQIKAAIKWLEKLAIKVEPVEINVIES